MLLQYNVFRMKRLFLNQHLRNRFGERVQRIPIDTGSLCPNRVNGHGCIFCDPSGSAASWIRPGMSIQDQLKRGSGIAVRRYKSKKFIAYFQAFTSTASSVQELDRIYKQVLEFPGMVGMAISTRPDCISDEVFDLIKEYSSKTYVWMELGAQSMIDDSLDWINRGHKAEVFSSMVKKFKKAGIETVGHIIFGLPVETKAQTMASFKDFLSTGVDGYKIHALHIIKDTELHKMYLKKPFDLLTMDEYIELVKEAVSITPENIVIHRLTAETEPSRLIAPLWVTQKNEILRRIIGDLGL